MTRLLRFARTASVGIGLAGALAVTLYAQSTLPGSSFCVTIDQDSTVESCLLDNSAPKLIILGRFTGSSPPTTANRFARGAVMLGTTTGTDSLVFVNKGTSASPSWQQVMGQNNIRQTTCSLTNAQVLALHSTAITCDDFAAPGSGYFLEIIDGDVVFDYTGAYTLASAIDLRFFYSARLTGIAASSVIETTGLLDATADTIQHFKGLADGTNPPTANQAIVLANTNGIAFGGGNASNALRFYISYRTRVTGL